MKLNACGKSIRKSARESVGWNQWKGEYRGREEGFKKCSSLWLALLASKWQTNGTAIWQEFSLLLPTFNRPWHEHPVPCTRFSSCAMAATFSSSICFMARNGDTVQPLVITAASYQPGRQAGRQTARESRRYKTAAARHGAVRRVAGGARAGSRQQSAGPSSGQAVRAISLLTIVIATLPTFSHPTQRQFVCTSAVHSGPKVRKLREINHDCWIDGNQSASPVEYVCQLNHCAAAETRTEACRECLVQVAWGLGHVTGSYLTSPGTHRWPQSPEWFCQHYSSINEYYEWCKTIETVFQAVQYRGKFHVAWHRIK